MNTETYEIANEVLEVQTRRRKQIPVAVFTVITIHVALFLALLGSSGCKGNGETKGKSAAEQMRSTEYGAATTETQVNSGVAPAILPTPAPAAQITSPVQTITEEPVHAPRTITPVATPDNGVKTHVVKSGDNLSKIARQYGVSIKTLKQSNNLQSDTIKVGQKLRVG